MDDEHTARRMELHKDGMESIGLALRGQYGE